MGRCGLGRDPLCQAWVYFFLQVLFYQWFKQKNKFNPEINTSCVNPVFAHCGGGCCHEGVCFLVILVPVVGEAAHHHAKAAAQGTPIITDLALGWFQSPRAPLDKLPTQPCRLCEDDRKK